MCTYIPLDNWSVDSCFQIFRGEDLAFGFQLLTQTFYFQIRYKLFVDDFARQFIFISSVYRRH